MIPSQDSAMDADALVVGAGAVGLAVGRALALAGFDTIIAEGEGRYGSGVSSRNSEVVHAGLYYPPGSLKARLCVAGWDALWRYCESRHVQARRTGKLIVAVEAAQQPELDALAANAEASEAGPLTPLTAAEARAMEPSLRADAALLSPWTGIVDSHALMTAYLADAEDAGAIYAPRATVEGAEPVGGGWSVRLAEGEAITARWLVNAAGLGALALAERIEGLDRAQLPRGHCAKGNYFGYAGRAPSTASFTRCRKRAGWAFILRSTSPAAPVLAPMWSGSTSPNIPSIRPELLDLPLRSNAGGRRWRRNGWCRTMLVCDPSCRVRERWPPTSSCPVRAIMAFLD